MLDVLGLLLDVGKTTFDLLGKSNVRKDTRREKVAEYLDKIAVTLSKSAQSFKQGEIPHGQCLVMEQLAMQLPKTIGDFIGESQAIDLQNKLLQAHNVEMFMSGLSKNDKKEREQVLIKMEQAAGLFEATAITIRASN